MTEKIIRLTLLGILFFLFNVNSAPAAPPYLPNDLTLTYTPPSGVTLTWSAPFGPGPVGYHIYRDHELIGTVPAGAALTWSDTLPGYGIYAYAVRAYNADGESDIRVHRSVVWLNPSGRANTLRQWGITWHFAAEHDFGQFANGDFWVRGPINIIGMTPACQTVTDVVEGATISRTINGAMLDPYFATASAPNPQGYDSAQRNYSDPLNVAKTISPSTPLNIPGGHSLVSTQSNYPLGTGHLYNTRLKVAAVLTVVNTAPAAGSFRPSYASADKTIPHNISDLNYAALLNLATPSGISVNLEDKASRIERVFLDNNGSDFNLEQRIFPEENMSGYGREVSVETGDVALLLNLNYSNAQKEKLLINFVQMGIDLFGVTGRGAGAQAWKGWGGHFTGRKLPIVFAGLVLSDDAMKNVNASFAEDTLTYYYNDPNLSASARNQYSWTGSKVLYKFNYHWDDPRYAAVYEHKEPAAWTKEGDTVPYITDESCENYRICCSSRSWVGIALAVRLMGAQSIWNKPSFFDYLDRYMHEDMTPFLPIMNAATGGSVTIGWYRSSNSTLVNRMWTEYRNFSDTQPPTRVLNLAVTALPDGSRSLSWGRAGDNIGGVGYRVLRNGAPIATVYSPRYSDAASAGGATLAYSIIAFDGSGNAASPSDSATPVIDATPPAAPSGLTVN